MPSSRAHCGFTHSTPQTAKIRKVRARIYGYQRPPHYISALEHQCRNHATFPILEYHFGAQEYIHDALVTLHTSEGISTYQFFFTKHSRLPVNPSIRNVEWRGSIAVFRSAKQGGGCVNVRAGETDWIDYLVFMFTGTFVKKKRYPRRFDVYFGC